MLVALRFGACLEDKCKSIAFVLAMGMGSYVEFVLFPQWPCH